MKISCMAISLGLLTFSLSSHAQLNRTKFIDKIFPKSPVSMKKTIDSCFVKKEKMLPRGSALITSSGVLSQEGISAIIHAATGAMTRSGGAFEPNEESIRNSIMNSLLLARKFRHDKVAIPFIGGGIFAGRMGMTKAELAKVIVEASIKFKKKLEVVFVLYTPEEQKIFSDILSHMKGVNNVKVLRGSITDFKLHGASAIVNAANMEVAFGGGISGFIGTATGEADKIDEVAADAIKSVGQRCAEDL